MKNTPMKKIIFFLILISNVFLMISQEKKEVALTVNISGMKSNKGTILIALYNSKEDFLKKRYREAILKIKNKKAVVIFENLEKGVYAITLFHDENGNQKMDTNFFGIPKESYGTSNGAKGFMGPPKYEDAKFLITQNNTITITLN